MTSLKLYALLVIDMPAKPEIKTGLEFLGERLSLSDAAREVDRLAVSFKEILTRKKGFPHGVTYQLDESPDGIALRVSQSSPKRVESIILVRKGDSGGIHFIEARKSWEPEVYAHTPLALKKVEEFLQNLTYDFFTPS